MNERRVETKRRHRAVIGAFLVVFAASFFPASPPADARGPIPTPVPNAYVITGGSLSTGLLGGGLLVVGPGVVGSSVPAAIGVAGGSTVAGLGAAAAASGFALGWLGMTAACGSAVSSGLIDGAARLITGPIIGNETGTVCRPYEFQDGGFQAPPQITSAEWQFTTVPAQPSRQEWMKRIVWDYLPDFAEGAQSFGGRVVNMDGDPLPRQLTTTFAEITGCLAVGPWSSGWLTMTGRFDTCRPERLNNSPKSAPPYVDGWFTVITDGSFQNGRRNGPYRPGDRIEIRQVDYGNASGRLSQSDPVYGIVPAFPEADARGLELRYRTSADCEARNGQTTIRHRDGAWAFESQRPEIPPHGCLTTELPRRIWTDMIVPGRVPNTTTTERIIETELPDVAPQLEECFRGDRQVPCQLVTTTSTDDPDTITGCTFGGNAAPLSWCAPVPVTPAFDPSTGLQNDTNPSPTTTVPPATTTPPTTTPPPTTAPPDTGVPPSDPPPPPAPPGDGDNQWSTCMEDQVDSDWSEITFNPVTWVRALIFYITAPIICALWWLVVPPGGFDSLLDDFLAVVDESSLIGIWRSLTDSFTWSAGCAPVTIGDPLGANGPSLGTIDVGMCGNLVIAFVWTVVLALAVLSMAGQLVRTVWTLGAYQKTGYI